MIVPNPLGCCEHCKKRIWAKRSTWTCVLSMVVIVTHSSLSVLSQHFPGALLPSSQPHLALGFLLIACARSISQLRPLYRVCLLSCSVVSDSLQPYGLLSAKLLCPWDSQGENTGVGCHALPQGISWLGVEAGSPALAGRFFTTSTTFIPSSNSALQRFCQTGIFQLQRAYRASWGIQIKCRSLFNRFEYIFGTFCLSNRLQCFGSLGHSFCCKSLGIQINQHVLFLIRLNDWVLQSDTSLLSVIYK